MSDGRNLMAKVLLAEDYARLVFDADLHDRLCREVIDADPVVPGLTLANTLAQEKARESARRFGMTILEIDRCM